MDRAHLDVSEQRGAHAAGDSSLKPLWRAPCKYLKHATRTARHTGAALPRGVASYGPPVSGGRPAGGGNACPRRTRVRASPDADQSTCVAAFPTVRACGCRDARSRRYDSLAIGAAWPARLSAARCAPRVRRRRGAGNRCPGGRGVPATRRCASQRASEGSIAYPAEITLGEPPALWAIFETDFAWQTT